MINLQFEGNPNVSPISYKINRVLKKSLFFLLGILWYLQTAIAVEVKVPRISPLPVSENLRQLSLNGQWAFSPLPEHKFWEKKTIHHWDSIQVPGEWVMQGFKVEKNKSAGYFRTFTLPASWKGQRIKLRCNAVYSECKIFINGEAAGAHSGGFTAFELDITHLVKFGKENRIALTVVSEGIFDDISSASRYAAHPLGGISRDIYLLALPEVNFSMFHASTSLDATYTNALLKTEVMIANESSKTAKHLSMEFILKDAKGDTVLIKPVSYPIPAIASKAVEPIKVSFHVDNPVKWDSEHPYLYTLICKLKNKQNTVSTTFRRIGFRQIDVRGNQVFVNNKPIKLRGVCHHEVMPLRGRSLTGDIWRKDVEIFRRGNVNYIRTSHYPPDEALLEACDELGMFVEVEAPFCWAHKTEVPANRHYEVLVNQHVEMVNLYRSHPSILMWSMGNESKNFNEYFKQASEVVKQIDPTRPRIFSQWKPNGDEGFLEITNHHYPGPKGPKKYKNHKRPVVFDEFCHVNAYNRLELAADPGLRNMWGALLDSMWDAMYHSKGVLGGAIWVGIDDTFFLPGEKAVGYGTWGTIDGWRREKPEYWGMKKAYSPVKVTLARGMDKDGKVLLYVENRHLFTNLSECKLEWNVNGKRGVIVTDIAARSKGNLEVVLPKSLRQAQVMELIITGVRGFEIDRYRFQLSASEIMKRTSNKGSGKLICRESADIIQINTEICDFAIDKHSGLFSVQRGGKVVLNNAPSLMILPLNKNGEGIQMIGEKQNFTPYNPLCENWKPQSVVSIPSEEVVEVKVQGCYKEAEGTLIYRFYPNGEVTLAYDFSMLCSLSPRQIGLVFTLPSSYSNLAWKRKGYWNVYPQNHIGALEGEAKAFEPALPISGLAGPTKEPVIAWSFDQTVNGSNIFRSTKEFIYLAELRDSKGVGVSVISDGTQHFRAWIDGTHTRFLVADYNNAGSENYLVSHAKNRYKPLNKGDKVNGLVKLNFAL